MAGKGGKRKKRPVITPSPKIPAPKRMPGGRPLQPRYEKPEKPEGTAGVDASEIKRPQKIGRAPDSYTGHYITLGEDKPKKEEKPKPNVRMNLLAGLVAGLIAAGVIAGVFWSQGFFGGGGGGGGGTQTWKIYSQNSAGQVLTVTVNSSGNFVTATSWTGITPEGYSYPINITSGSMSGTTMTFTVSGSYTSGQGSLSGTYTGTLNASFPSATSVSNGTATGTISDPLGTRALSDTWTATRQS